MRNDDETTAVQRHTVLARDGINLSLRSILRSREQLGWTI